MKGFLQTLHLFSVCDLVISFSVAPSTMTMKYFQMQSDQGEDGLGSIVTRPPQDAEHSEMSPAFDTCSHCMTSAMKLPSLCLLRYSLLWKV